MTAPSIRPATPDDLDALTEALATQLIDDPMVDYLVRPDAKRPDALRRLLRETARRWYLPRAASWVALEEDPDGGDPVVVGALLSLPPGAKTGLGLVDSIRMVRHTIRISRLRGLWRAGQASGFLNYIHPRAPHYYVGWLGAPDDDTAAALLDALCERADAESRPAYAEAASAPAQERLRRAGFERRDEVGLPGGPELALMWRSPRPPAPPPTP